MPSLDSDAVEFAVNPDPRCPCVLLLDTSSSMDGDPIAALNAGLQVFQQDVQNDALAARRVELAIVTFGRGGVTVAQPFQTVGSIEVPTLLAGGGTPMGEAIERGLDLLRERKNQYKANGVANYRPWIFLITDGAPTDSWTTAAERVKREEKANGVAFFSVGVNNADMDMLKKLSAIRQPVKLAGLSFREMFLWLSGSQKTVSGSRVGDQTALAPVGWGAV